MNRIRIEHGGYSSPFGRVSNADTAETIDGVRSVSLEFGHDTLPTARIEVFVAEVDVTVEADHVQWLGLDDVPSEALLAELARREARSQESAT